jgi:hypothetical protein
MSQESSQQAPHSLGAKPQAETSVSSSAKSHAPKPPQHLLSDAGDLFSSYLLSERPKELTEGWDLVIKSLRTGDPYYSLLLSDQSVAESIRSASLMEFFLRCLESEARENLPDDEKLLPPGDLSFDDIARLYDKEVAPEAFGLTHRQQNAIRVVLALQRLRDLLSLCHLGEAERENLVLAAMDLALAAVRGDFLDLYEPNAKRALAAANQRRQAAPKGGRGRAKDYAEMRQFCREQWPLYADKGTLAAVRALQYECKKQFNTKKPPARRTILDWTRNLRKK